MCLYFFSPGIQRFQNILYRHAVFLSCAKRLFKYSWTAKSIGVSCSPSPARLMSSSPNVNYSMLFCVLAVTCHGKTVLASTLYPHDYQRIAMLWKFREIAQCFFLWIISEPGMCSPRATESQAIISLSETVQNRLETPYQEFLILQIGQSLQIFEIIILSMYKNVKFDFYLGRNESGAFLYYNARK